MALFGSKDVIGIDIGTKVLKVLHIIESHGKIQIINFAQKDLSSLAIEGKSPEEKILLYIDALKTLLKKHKFSVKNAAISISGSSVIVRFVKFAKMSKQDLEKTLQFEAEPHIPFDIQEVQMDAHIIGDVQEDEQTKMETVLVAGKKDAIYEKIEIIEKSGLRPSIVDVDAFALEQAYEMINREVAESLVMLVNIGASITNISIVENGIAKVVRDLYTAGSSFTRVIIESMQVTAEKAESLKKEYGLLGGFSNQNHGLDADACKQIYNALYPIIKELNSELQRSIDYFTGQQVAPDTKIEKIVISGGSANLKGLAELIGVELKIPVEVFRPLENADTSKFKGEIDKSSPALAVVVGLALRQIGDNKT